MSSLSLHLQDLSPPCAAYGDAHDGLGLSMDQVSMGMEQMTRFGGFFDPLAQISAISSLNHARETLSSAALEWERLGGSAPNC